jgi:hypothetical protein
MSIARSEKRTPQIKLAHMSSMRLARHEVIVSNLSSEGLGIISKSVLPRVGEHVTLDFGRGELRYGSVRWTEGNKVGIALEP